MTILTISGSSRTDSSNRQLLLAIAKEFSSVTFLHHPLTLPLFLADNDKAPFPEAVITFRQAVRKADAVIISTPEYIHNIPAILKNALEWLTTSGELNAKPVLAITYSPHPPRGEKAMFSLLASLQALEARIVGQLPLYQTEVKVEEGKIVGEEEVLEMIREGVNLLI